MPPPLPPLAGSVPGATTEATPGKVGYRLASADLPAMPFAPPGGRVSTRPPIPKLTVGKAAKPKRPAPRRDLLIFLLVFAAIIALGGGAYFVFSNPDGIGVTDGENSVAGATVTKRPGSGSLAGELNTKPINPQVIGTGTTPSSTVSGGVDEAPPKDPVDPSAVLASTSNKDNGLGGASASTTVLVPTPRPTPTPPPAPSERFIRYSEALSVSGVYQGEPPRALIEGRIIRLGEIIDPEIGITFTGVDSITKHLILQEPTGAVLRVKY